MDASVGSGSKQRHYSRQWPKSHDFRSRVWLRPEYVASRRSRLRGRVSHGFVRSSWRGRLRSVGLQFEEVGSLAGYADDLIEIVHELHLQDAIFVGHSVSAMIGVLASIKEPQLFKSLILIGPSPDTSTTAIMWADFRQRRLTSCSTFSAPTIWAGLRQSPPPLWATQIVRSLARS